MIGDHLFYSSLLDQSIWLLTRNPHKNEEGPPVSYCLSLALRFFLFLYFIDLAALRAIGIAHFNMLTSYQ